VTKSRDERIEEYYQQSAWDLAEWLVDAEDEIEVWKLALQRQGEKG
jgi:hypothetical protein